MLAAIFREEFSVQELPVRVAPVDSSLLARREDPGRSLLSCGFAKPNGSAAFVYWMPAEILTTTYEATITVECCSLPGEAKLIDLLEGTIYSIPESMVENDGKGYRRFLHLPLRDYPLLLTFGDFAE